MMILASIVFTTEMRFRESKDLVRVGNTMVHNPIYDGDGPVYESVKNQPQLATDTPAQYDSLRQTTAAYTVHDVCSVHVPHPDNYANSNNYHCNSDTFTCTDNTAPGYCSNPSVETKGSLFVSLSPTKKIALKKNGQERNKLHLTLSLAENDYNPPKREGGSFIQKPSPVHSDDSYTVMSPAGTLCHSNRVHSGTLSPEA